VGGVGVEASELTEGLAQLGRMGGQLRARACCCDVLGTKSFIGRSRHKNPGVYEECREKCLNSERENLNKVGKGLWNWRKNSLAGRKGEGWIF